MKNRGDLPIKTLHLSDRDKTKFLWAIDQANHETLEDISQQLKGVGSGYGFPAISDKASELLRSLNDDDAEAAELDQIRKTASELVAILNRVKLN